MKNLKLDFFPVIYPDGRVVKCGESGKIAYPEINEAIGGLIDSITILPDVGLCGYVHDEGIIMDLPLNVPLVLATGFVVAGPVMLTGVNNEGDSIPPTVPEPMWRFLAEVCTTLFTANNRIQQVRENPGPHFMELTEENLEKVLKGEL